MRFFIPGCLCCSRFRLFIWLDRIDYDERIQCLECVVILEDDTQCVDKRLKNKKRSRQANLLATDAA